MAKAKPCSAHAMKGDKSQRTFTGPSALQVAMPLGGIGAGCICINGQGGFQDFFIRNRPSLSARPDGPGSERDVAFAVLHVKGRNPVTRVVEGVIPAEKIYSLGLRGNGFRGGGHEGLPRFARSSFRGEFPFATVALSDRDVPLGVKITAFSPMISLDDHNSSIPCAIAEYTLHNRSRKKIDFEFSFHVNHWAAVIRID